MRRTCREAADTLALLGALCQPGVTTDEIDRACHDECLRRNSYPSPLEYPGGGGVAPFPKSLCTSVNEVICHGIPDDRPLADGDIVNGSLTLFSTAAQNFTRTPFPPGRAHPL